MRGEGRDLALVDAVGTRLGDSQIGTVDSSLAFPSQNRDPGGRILTERWYWGRSCP